MKQHVDVHQHFVSCVNTGPSICDKIKVAARHIHISLIFSFNVVYNVIKFYYLKNSFAFLRSSGFCEKMGVSEKFLGGQNRELLKKNGVNF